MHTKLARIKNLKNLNIGTDRPMQQRRPRSDAAENKGMKRIWGNRENWPLGFSRSSSGYIRFLIKASIGVFTCIPVFFMGIPVFR